MSSRREVTDRIPVNLPAEQNLIGCLLRGADEFWAVSGIVEAGHFHVPLHREIFSAIKDICETGKQVSTTALCARLDEEDEQGRPMYAVLLSLLENAREAGAALDYAAAVAETSGLRRLIAIGDAITKTARSAERPAVDIIAEAVEKLSHVTHAQESEVMPIGKVVAMALRESEEEYRRNGDDQGPGRSFTTGLPSLDGILGPLRRKRLYFLGGAEKSGKTALVSQVWKHIAKTSPTLMAQGEMSVLDTGVRALSDESGISSSTIESASYTLAEYDEISNASRRLQSDRRLFWRFKRATVTEIKHRCIAEKRKHGDLGAVIVDHLLLVDPGKEYENEFRGITKVVQSLKDMADDLDTVVIVMTHRTRGSQDRSDPMPWPSDFYGGGVIERTCDALICIYSIERWMELRKNDNRGEKAADEFVRKLDAARGKVQVSLLAHRHAPFPRTVNFKWLGSLVKVAEVE